MDSETIQLIDKLLINAIEERKLESAFSSILEEMSENDRSELTAIFKNRAQHIQGKSSVLNVDLINDYLTRKLDELDDFADPIEPEIDNILAFDDGDNWDEMVDELEDDLVGDFAEYDGVPHRCTDPYTLVNRLIDNCIEEHWLSIDYCDLIRNMDDAGRKEVADLIISRVQRDPTAQLPKYERDPVYETFEKVMRERIEELKSQRP